MGPSKASLAASFDLFTIGASTLLGPNTGLVIAAMRLMGSRARSRHLEGLVMRQDHGNQMCLRGWEKPVFERYATCGLVLLNGGERGI